MYALHIGRSQIVFFEIMDNEHIHEQFLSKWMDTDENMDEKLQEKLMKFRSPLYEENIYLGVPLIMT